MAKGKKGKGKGKGKGPAGPEVVTTRHMLRERERMMCPRLGDAAERSERADAIRLQCVYQRIQRCVETEKAELNMSRSNLGFVPDEVRDIEELQKLTAVDLSRNQLFSSAHVFGMIAGLGKLRVLNLADNFFNGPLAPEATSLKTLEELYLDGNQLTALPEDAGNWAHMTRFSASKNELKEFPESAAKWTKLKYLNLRANKLAALPAPAVAAWVELETLYLGTNEIASLPDEVGNLTKLREIDARTNLLSRIPEPLANCVELRKVHLGNNRLSEVPADVLQRCGSIEELHLYKNKLDSLPESIGALTSMNRLTLSSNNLRTLPETISGCTSLAELYINNCAKFATLPASSGDLVNLQELQAKKCPGLKALPNTAVAWGALRELDLRAAKKQVCKLQPELIGILEQNQCKIRGGVQKKGGKKGKKK